MKEMSIINYEKHRRVSIQNRKYKKNKYGHVVILYKNKIWLNVHTRYIFKNIKRIKYSIILCLYDIF